MSQDDLDSRRLYSYRIRRSPYYDATQRYGCKIYTTYNHMYLPLVYEDPVADYWRLKRGVTLWDVGCQRQVEITGPEAFRFVQRLTPRNLTKCQVGQCKYVAITAENGGVLNDPVLLRLGENHFWLSVADRDILLWARGIAVGSGMEVVVQEPDVSPLAVQGPKSFAVVASLFGEWIRSLRYFWFRETELDGIPLILARSGWSKQGGFEIYLRDSRFGDQLWEAVMEAGKPYDIAPGAPSGIERIESGLLNYWSDMTEHENPFEIGLGRFVDLEQEADFIGKDALRRIRAAGIRRRLVGVEIHAEPLSGSVGRWPVRCQGRQVGHVTSAVYSPDLEKNIGYALVATECAESGTRLTVALPLREAEAHVRPLPFLPSRAAA